MQRPIRPTLPRFFCRYAQSLRWTLLLLALLPVGASQAGISLEAPPEVKPLLEKQLDLAHTATADEADRVGLRRRLRRQVSEVLATEGYFTPELTVDDLGNGEYRLTVAPGKQAVIADLRIEFVGAIQTSADGPQRMAALRSAWPLPAGSPFRDKLWSDAKQALLQPLLAEDFAAARISDSLADVDGEQAEVHLTLTVDSGPAFTLGDLAISGLDAYNESLIRRYNRLQVGERYSQDKLLALQTALQNTPYFSSVRVDIDTDPDHAQLVPVKVLLAEAKPRRASVGAGFSTNTGARGEISYRDADFLGRAWNLVSALHLDHTRQVLFADIFLPPPEDGRHRDSFGSLLEQTRNQGLSTHRGAFGVVRAQTRGAIETRLSLNFQREIQRVDEGSSDVANALTFNYSWTRRAVDNVLDPRTGNVINVQLGGASRALLSSQNFVRSYLHGQIYFPVGRRDVFSLRAETGLTAAASRHGVPEDFLFRAGGAQSIRGYSYQSLGPQEGGAVVGGRFLAVASAEYTHWFGAKWGGALFYDTGSATDSRQDFHAVQGLGLGARWKSPAGPLAFDLAYSRRDHQVRPHFALAIAF